MKKSIYTITLLLLFGVVTLFSSQQTAIAYAAGSTSLVSHPVKSYLLVDYHTGKTLTAQNEHEKRPVASIVKLMTTLLTLEALEQGKISLEDEVVASAHSASMGGSQAFLDAGQQYNVGELLKSIIVASANDSSVLMAEVLGGSEQNFVQIMNERAKQLGMKNTLYANASGLPEANQYSTAADSAIILREVLKHKDYFNYSKIWMDDFYHPLDGRKTELTNTNRLVRYYEGCDGGKTGYTDESGFCLVASAKKGNMRLIGVALGAQKSKERFEIVSDLLTHGFAHYKNEHIAVAGQELEQTLPLRGSKNGVATLTFATDFYYITKKGEDAAFQIKLELPKRLKAPLLAGQAVGKAYIIKESEILGEIDVVAMQDTAEQTMQQILRKVFAGWGVN